MAPQENMVNKKERNVNLDIIRCTAIFMVILVHFFLNSEFYWHPIVGKRMYTMTILCTFAYICVPLFILLTGYLMCQKKLSYTYYKGIRKTLAIYLLASLVCLAYRYLIVHETFSISAALFRILSFRASGYAWYIEMYIGLFLMIPFLNLIYRNLGSQKEKLVLIITCLVLTTLPSLLNQFDWHTVGWWAQPSMSQSYDKLIPAWWENLYPITYYFIGAYLSEFSSPLRKRVSFPLMLIALFTFSIYNIYRCKDGGLENFLACQWFGFECVILSVLTFLFLLRLPTQPLPRWLKVFFARIADLSLGAYLVSWVWDQYAYTKFKTLVTYIPMRLNYLPILVGFVFICSLVTSSCIHGIYALICKGGSALRNGKTNTVRKI